MTTASAARSFLPLAHRLADAAGRIVARYFRTPVAIDDKPDASPVTVADREVEASLREMIAAEAPGHGVLGEEQGADRIDAEWVWVLDPIDGTKAFITGMPTFGTLIALVHGGEPVLGVLDQPISRERWVGVRGEQTAFNGRPVAARACGDLSGAYLFATSPSMFVGADEAVFARLASRVKLVRFGADCYAAGMIALGFADLMVEAQLKPYDYCALVPIVEGAGGRVTGWNGERLGLTTGSYMVAAGDPRVHDLALRALAGAPRP
jgi:inositol-phosphate phosphatase/L-galactose 1-phosphate phosphatase/histidinol-phosphatase